MRPLKLIIEGVNSFIEPQEIDFEAVGADNIFCISGPTGSGKSTILDCIILSLYERPTWRGNLADFINLKCKRASITFTFELDGEVYETRRTMARTNSKNGTLNSDMLLLRSGTPLAEGREAFAFLEERIGLEAKEFTNVVVLQQGEFARFLKSAKGARIDLIVKLFELGRFEYLDKKFRAKVAEINAEATSYTRTIETLEHLNDEYIKERQAEFDAKKKAVEEGERQAARLTEVAQKTAKAAEEYKKYRDAKAALDAVNARLAALDENLKKGEALSAQAERSDAELKLRESTRDALVKEQTELNAALKNADKAAELSKSRSTALKSSEQLNGEFKRLTDTVKMQSEEISVLEKSADEAFRALGLSGDDRRVAVTSAREQVKSKQAELVRLRQQVSAAADARDKSAAAEAAAKAEWQTVSNMHAETEMRAKEARADAASSRLAYDKAVEDNALALVTSSLREGDVCPVCGGKINALNALSEVDLTALKAELASKEERAESTEKLLGSSSVAFATAAQKVHAAGEELARQEQTLTAAKREADAVDGTALSKRGEALTTLADALSVLADKREKLNKLQSEQSVTALKAENEARTLSEIDKQIVELGKIPDRESISKRNAQIESVLNELRRERERVDGELKRCRDGVNELRTKITELNVKREHLIEQTNVKADEVSDAQAEQAKQAAEAASRAHVASVAELGTLAACLARDKADIERKAQTQKMVDKLAKQAKKYGEMEKMFARNRFTEFVAAEYIKEFTASASVKLAELTGGKYSMGYDEESGEFYVYDFLSGNSQRGVKTLSGGETFLASLSLAIAISKELSKNKNFDFFFVDEGFGTLSPDAIDMVTNALYTLSRDTLVGVITHRDELKERIPSAVEVACPDGEKGSTITLR